MTDTSTSAAMVEFLRWVDAAQRSYAEAMEAWQTSCPRSSVWEDASIADFIKLRDVRGVKVVTLTKRGKAIVDAG